MTHTKGPWKVMLNYDNRMDEEVEGRHTIKDAEGWNVARVWEMPTSEANARLIAQAPEMRRALDEIAEAMQLHLDDVMSTEEMRDAIAFALDIAPPIERE